MYLTKPKLIDIVSKQVRFKLNANAVSFSILVFLQLLALALSFPSMTSIDHELDVSLVEVSVTSHVIFAVLWTFFSGIHLANCTKWNETFTFVTTRFTHHLSNFFYMVIASFIASVMTVLASPTLRLLTYMRYDEIPQSPLTIIEAPMDFFIQFITAFLYLLLFFVIGYVIQSFVQMNGLLGSVYLIAIIFSLFIINGIFGVPLISNLVLAFLQERSLFLFSLKVIGAIAVLFSLSIWMTNRLEVRKS